MCCAAGISSGGLGRPADVGYRENHKSAVGPQSGPSARLNLVLPCAIRRSLVAHSSGATNAAGRAGQKAVWPDASSMPARFPTEDVAAVLPLLRPAGPFAARADASLPRGHRRRAPEAWHPWLDRRRGGGRCKAARGAAGCRCDAKSASVSPTQGQASAQVCAVLT